MRHSAKFRFFSPHRARRRAIGAVRILMARIGGVKTVAGTILDRLSEWLAKMRAAVANVDCTSGGGGGGSSSESGGVAAAASILEHIRRKIEDVYEAQLDETLPLRQYVGALVGELVKLRALCLVDAAFLARLRTDSLWLWTTLSGWSRRLEALLKSEPHAIRQLFAKIALSIGSLLDGVDCKNQALTSAIKEPWHEILSTFYHRKLETSLRRIVQARLFLFVICAR